MKSKRLKQKAKKLKLDFAAEAALEPLRLKLARNGRQRPVTGENVVGDVAADFVADAGVGDGTVGCYDVETSVADVQLPETS